MKTKKQEELVNAYLSVLEEQDRRLYREIILHLAELGYHPAKEKESISFKHDLHRKQMAKMGAKANKENGVSPVFSLRFSACHGYSQRFADIVSAYMTRYPARAARCISAGCDYCGGEADTHVYTCTFPDGRRKSHCGAYAIEIPDVAPNDIGEVKKLIQEEHDYLLTHEPGVTVV